MKTLSIVIPAYNEYQTIERIVEKIEKSLPNKMQGEIIIIDDNSDDGTREIIERLEQENRCKAIYFNKNQGKGKALREGFSAIIGDIVIIQDADMEYDPAEYQHMIQPIIDGHADVVYGSRFISHSPTRALMFWHYIGNRTITMLSNICTNLNLSDVETCYKAFSHTALCKIHPQLTSNRFGIEIEITALIAKEKMRVYEVGISYHGRTYEQGKKISWRDGVVALWYIVKYNFFK
jgi:glycosyltransferase involved in cell wall biosynthesis